MGVLQSRPAGLLCSKIIFFSRKNVISRTPPGSHPMGNAIFMINSTPPLNNFEVSRPPDPVLGPAPGVIPDGLCISKTNSTTGLKNYQRSYQLAMLALPAIFICSLTYCKGNRLRFLIKFSVQMIQVCQNNTDISK